MSVASPPHPLGHQTQSILDTLIQHAESHASAVAVRRKRGGIWHELTWMDLFQRVRHLALGLEQRGIGAGDHVLLIAENSVEWLVADLALDALGAHMIAIPPELAGEASAVARAYETRIAICGGHEQVDDLVSSDQLPVELIVVLNPIGVGSRDIELVSAADVERQGADNDLAHTFEHLREVHAAADGFSLVMTPGQHGTPRLVKVTAPQSLSRAVAVCSWLGLARRDQTMPILSLALQTPRVVDLYAPIVAGAQINFPEHPSTIAIDLRDVRPTLVSLSPRGLRLIRMSSDMRAGGSSWLKRRLYERAMASLGKRLSASTYRRPRVAPAWLLVGRPVMKKLGLGRARRIVCADGPAPDATARWYWALGAPILDLYAVTEAGGPLLGQRDFSDWGTSGVALADVETRLDASGELFVRSDGRDWLGTGDLAEEADGRIRVRGPLDTLRAAGDGTVLLGELERLLMESAYVRGAAVVMRDSGGLDVYIEPEIEAILSWARRRRMLIADAKSFGSDPAVVGLIDGELTRLTEPRGLVVERFVVVPRPFATSTGEITVTRRPQRERICDEYEHLLGDRG